MTAKDQALEIKDEDGYVDDWEIRKHSDCHPSSATRVYTQKELDIALASANKEIEHLKVNLLKWKENAEISFKHLTSANKEIEELKRNVEEWRDEYTKANDDAVGSQQQLASANKEIEELKSCVKKGDEKADEFFTIGYTTGYDNAKDELATQREETAKEIISDFKDIVSACSRLDSDGVEELYKDLEWIKSKYLNSKSKVRK